MASALVTWLNGYVENIPQGIQMNVYGSYFLKRDSVYINTPDYFGEEASGKLPVSIAGKGREKAAHRRIVLKASQRV